MTKILQEKKKEYQISSTKESMQTANSHALQEDETMVKDTSVQIRLTSERKNKWQKYQKKQGIESQTDFTIDAVEFRIDFKELYEEQNNQIKKLNDKIDKLTDLVTKLVEG